MYACVICFVEKGDALMDVSYCCSHVVVPSQESPEFKLRQRHVTPKDESPLPQMADPALKKRISLPPVPSKKNSVAPLKSPKKLRSKNNPLTGSLEGLSTVGGRKKLPPLNVGASYAE